MSTHPAPSAPHQEQATAIIREILPDIIAVRRHLHQNPELSWQERETSAFLLRNLQAIPAIRDARTIAQVGVVASITGAKPGRTIALRGDMDALALTEQRDGPYRSTRDGVMHACGHDGHMAILLGTARVLSRMQDALAGTVRFIFQPAEEGGFGARKLCEEGVLASPAVDAIFGLHGWPQVPVGRIGVKAGPLMAADTHFSITVSGKGCHAAMPNLGTDQILIMARIIDALQAVRSRQTAPTEALTLTVTKIHGGTAINIIPATIRAEGTLRTIDKGTLERSVSAMQAIVTHVAKAHGAEALLEVTDHYPVTSNDKTATAQLRKVAHAWIGPENTLEIETPTMGAEDFAYYLQKVPGSFFFLGTSPSPSEEASIPLHHPAFDFNDDALFTGISMMVALALSSEVNPSFL